MSNVWSILFGLLAVLLVAALASVPFFANVRGMAIAINIASYTVLATAWGLFAGPTRYFSLATVAFFGLGAYVTAVFAELVPWPVVMLIAAAVSIVLAALVGLATLRLRAAYFIVFTFGLAELVRQLVTWFEMKQSRALVRQIAATLGTSQVYWHLLAIAVATYLSGFLIYRSRYGLALRALSDDETAARHTGIDTSLAKVALFMWSAAFMGLTGAVMAQRWPQIDPTIAFNPVISFTVLIMAMLGGYHRMYGPVLAVAPLVVLFEYLVARFPDRFSVMVGVLLIFVVFAMPRGIVGVLENLVTRLWRRTA